MLIDALDECSDMDVRSVVEFLEDLSIKAVHAGATLRICLSSRHYPTIDMNKKITLTLERRKQHQEDIAKYVPEKMEFKDGESRAKIEKKSDGVFLWAILVVAMLNKAYRAGHAEEMEDLLDSLLGDLEAVLNTILGKDVTKNAETVLIFQMVLFSSRPMTQEELFFGITAEKAMNPKNFGMILE